MQYISEFRRLHDDSSEFSGYYKNAITFLSTNVDPIFNDIARLVVQLVDACFVTSAA